MQLQARQQPAHRLQRESEIAADVFARHAEMEAIARISELLVTARQAQQEGAQALFRGHAAEQQHQTLVT